MFCVCVLTGYQLPGMADGEAAKQEPPLATVPGLGSINEVELI